MWRIPSLELAVETLTLEGVHGYILELLSELRLWKVNQHLPTNHNRQYCDITGSKTEVYDSSCQMAGILALRP